MKRVLVSTKIGTLALAFVLEFLCANANAEPMFAVTRHSFSRGVVNHEPLHPYSDPTEIRAGEALYFWTEIAVNESGLRYLKAYGHLPVLVAWGKDGLLVGRLVDIGIKKTEWQASREKIIWMSGSANDATFLWRTQAIRENVNRGQHYLSVLDPNRRAVQLVGEGLAAFRPTITIVGVKN